ncbi:MAG: type II toxin-antitoxin system RelE/ParE family toxin [Bacteroidia bacterium]|nr:type II toxin-antitoxin system RelE/ParE family toxin [Bacteroidia bacterium]
MLVEFEKEYLAELYEKGKCSSKKYRFQPSVVKNYKRRIDTLIDAPNIEALYLINSLNYEVLKGDKRGISSIRIDRQYRLEFEVSKHDSGETIFTICSILDISNHYE